MSAVAAARGESFVSLDDGLSIMSKHARNLGYDAVVLFLDELRAHVRGQELPRAGVELHDATRLWGSVRRLDRCLDARLLDRRGAAETLALPISAVHLERNRRAVNR